MPSSSQARGHYHERIARASDTCHRFVSVAAAWQIAYDAGGIVRSTDRLLAKRVQARGSASEDGLDHSGLPELIGYQLRLTQLAVFRDFSATTGDLGVSPGRFGMLILIEANPGVTQSRLARAVGLDRSTMVAVLDQLEERSLVERRQGADRRTNGLWLTKEGKALLAKMKRRVGAHEARLAQRLTAGEWAELKRLLTKLRPE